MITAAVQLMAAKQLHINMDVRRSTLTVNNDCSLSSYFVLWDHFFGVTISQFVRREFLVPPQKNQSRFFSFVP